MQTKARMLVVPWMFTAVAGCLLSAAVANAAATRDRVYQFGDDPAETGEGENNFITAFGGTTLDSEAIGSGDFHDLSTVAMGAQYTNTATTMRPGHRPTEWGVRFDGVNDHLFINGIFSTGPGVGAGGLGIPSQADGQALYGNAVNWTGITNRYIEGWVRPTGSTAAGRQDIVSDTDQFTIFISAPTGPDRFWGMTHGDPNPNDVENDVIVVSDVAVDFNQWHHVMQRSFSGDAVLYVNGVGILHTTQATDTTPEAANNFNLVFGAGVNKTSNFFTGVLDNFVMGVAGNNSNQAAAPPLPAGMDWGAVDMAIDNDYIRQELVGIDAGDVNMDGDVDVVDVNIFKANWLSEKSINGFEFGDLETRMVGDFNFDGIVDLDDAIVLRQGLIDANSGAVLDLGSLVPEPTSALLLVFGLVSAAGLRRRRS